MVYRQKVHRGEHEPIVDRALFEAVQAKLADGSKVRRLRLRASPAILTGRLFDDRGNRMTPTHANKRGARYRYYVSHALLQNRPDAAGTVPRVSAPDIEGIVIAALRERLGQTDEVDGTPLPTDRDLIERHVERVIIKSQAIELRLLGDAKVDEEQERDRDRGGVQPDAGSPCPAIITIPWSRTPSEAAKGIVHSPSSGQTMHPQTRDALLTTIAKARAWIDDLAQGRATSFAEIAEREGKVERHVRFLAPLAFVAPRVIAAILDGSGRADLTVTDLAKALPYSWAEQERRLGLSRAPKRQWSTADGRLLKPLAVRPSPNRHS